MCHKNMNPALHKKPGDETPGSIHDFVLILEFAVRHNLSNTIPTIRVDTNISQSIFYA